MKILFDVLIIGYVSNAIASAIYLFMNRSDKYVSLGFIMVVVFSLIPYAMPVWFIAIKLGLLKKFER